LTKETISALNEATFHRLESLLDYFDIEYTDFENRLAFPCPVHGGDNPEGCCVFTDGNSQKGNWTCWTAHCEEDYVSNLFGFTRGCLTAKRGKPVSMNETASFLFNFLNTDISELEMVPAKQTRVLDIFNRKIQRRDANISRAEIRNKINIPADYYLNRGYGSLVLEAFDVGECLVEGQPMSQRVVIPLYDECNNYAGCIGRAIKEHLKPKWLHSKGFDKNILYGLNLAKEKIRETGTVILVEGQGDVWRAFEAGLEMTVGIFGTSLSEDQLILLECSGALNVVILTDYDEAGIKACEKIAKKCGRRFNIIRPDLDDYFIEREIPTSERDLGTMPIEDVKTEIYPYIKGM
jgi:5S rRNA maturation endonuclease (ribonuclease M5)